MNAKGNLNLPGEDGLDVEYLTQYKNQYGSHKDDRTIEDCVRKYNDMSDEYEKDLSKNHYNGPLYAADTIHKYFKDQPNVKILDVAAGTGYLGELLQSHGFKYIDALEPAINMLEKAGTKNVYKKLICKFMEERVTDIEDDEYECVATSGGMGIHHIPCRGLTEMCRLAKPGGLVIIVMREEFLSIVEEYANRLEPFMKELEQLGKWQLVERTVVPKYSFGKNGVIFVYKVRENGLKAYTSNIV